MRHLATASGAALMAIALAACGGGGGDGGTGAGGTGGAPADLVDGATFTMATSADPGSLDPQMSASSILLQLSGFAYDSLVSSASDGTIVKGLATDWKVDGTKVTMTIGSGITCSDGSAFTAADAAANINFMGDPANKSAFIGVFVPSGAKAAASGSTLTVTLAAPAPFVLEGLAVAPMVCKSGLANRKGLEKQTAGTGPYQLTEVVPSDHFTYTKRQGYTWGPNGATTAEKGMPQTVTVKVVPNQTTAANLLLSGGLNAATITGQDATRLEGAKLFSSQLDALVGQMWFNHTSGRPGADKDVRKALTQALDLAQVREVFTAKQGAAPTTFSVVPPLACPGDSVTPALPKGGLDAAKQALDAAGWTAGSDGIRAKDGKPLAATFVYQSAAGASGAAAAELAAGVWKQLGANVTLKAQDQTALLQTMFSSGDWDVAWLPLNVSSPDQLVPFLSGPAAPNGNNFAHIDNPAYTEAVTAAAKLPGKEGCATWLKAETVLVTDADVVPFANQPAKTFGQKAQFTSGSSAVAPTSIRMLAG
ncbi:peptide/nickel transport system substrate-binding protein [Terracoccus luteus]|uniref:Peptide/nickel transport system substrate-binding protein n=1 Tax=Terracoccus luteus TaxID=53356 RepID=A0A495XQ65_9MICO|nr:ABC transporter substrate-binding protein [Terracoccus luteus]RKT76731.1 peptide/nickel transport system substrate-binding protein [Terracoccus luteus]